MKTTITVPENLNEISLGQYQKYIEVTKDLEGEFLMQRTIEILCSISFSRVVLITHKDVKEVYTHLLKLLSSEVEFKHRFKIKSQEFGFMPDLEEITSGEFADLTAYAGKPEDMHKAMAVMFRPITKRVGEKYDIFPYKGTKEFSDVMRFMPLGIALGAFGFFLNLAKELMSAIQYYSNKELTNLMEVQLPISVKSGVSTKTFTPSQKETLETLMK